VQSTQSARRGEVAALAGTDLEAATVRHHRLSGEAAISPAERRCLL
jgi:hypothetical protein